VENLNLSTRDTTKLLRKPVTRKAEGEWVGQILILIWMRLRILDALRKKKLYYTGVMNLRPRTSVNESFLWCRPSETNCNN
jgi:hypothetical protein